MTMLHPRSYEAEAHSAWPGVPPTRDIEWLRTVGLMNDYLRVPYANGSSFASQLLHRELTARGHAVTVVGPHDPAARPHELPPRRVELSAIPLRNHPGVQLAMPSPDGLARLANAGLDLMVAQTCQAMLHGGVWLRQTQGVPFVCVNTVHMPSVYNVMLPDRLNDHPLVRDFFQEQLVPWVEGQTASVYNQCDCLVVLSPGLERYWRRLGVTVPIRVIPRAIEPALFDTEPSPDPFPPGAVSGGRLLVACRHTREKEIDRLLEIFAHYLVPRHADVSLTLVGDGPDHDAFIKRAEELGVAHRTFFVGEQSLSTMASWYRHADLFVYTSLSETYGQVVSEALYCRLPVVAFDDGMGVAGQITQGEDGCLVDPTRPDADATYAGRVSALLLDDGRRQAMAETARRLAVKRCDRDRCIDRYYETFDLARLHRHTDSSSVEQTSPSKPLARWAMLHGMAGALGCLRKPAELNRSGSITPTWTSQPFRAIAGMETLR